MKKTVTILLFFLTVQLSAQCWESMSAGYNHSLAIKDDGTLWAWGANTAGKLGIGGGSSQTKTIPTQIGFDTNWQQVCANFSSSFAIKTDGTLWAWGWNSDGDLGLGTTTTAQHTPIQVGTDTNWQTISSSDDFCLALKTDGTLWAWGKNNFGQLGDNSTINKIVPTQIGTDTDWQLISAGHSHSLALKSNGTLWAWGYNPNGRLGDGTNIARLVPTQIGTATNWQKIDAGNGHSFAIKTDGTLWAWGTNTSGEFGTGTLPLIANVPIQLGTDTNWKEVSASQWFSYAIKSDNTLWSTGRSNEGQLGNGTNSSTNVLVFTQVGTSSDTDKIVTGFLHVLAKNQDGFISGTGENNRGQLGDGTTTNKNIFTAISCYQTVLSNDNFTLNEVKIYPNPVNDILNFSFDKEIRNVSIFNVLGQEILSKSFNENQSSINVSSLSPGTYLVKLNSENDTKTVKIIKK
ncbi:T9SS type A sorting domain-containing protein [Flavobacterium sp. NST-5]|uniref:T9SS type A sorting domain-containing protein n=1 Tax=Flavobacterium ichthyis TaxID=2698827 RepID=A0ABW9Z4C4_9FLAO|nr:T9SS type A sorting domain-containing protein [Flavobacterium ichthyis]NBL63692.1 T9SS type A sorting domain-containing protein [Flavobacterium ichthyis]